MANRLLHCCDPLALAIATRKFFVAIPQPVWRSRQAVWKHWILPGGLVQGFPHLFELADTTAVKAKEAIIGPEQGFIWVKNALQDMVPMPFHQDRGCLPYPCAVCQSHPVTETFDVVHIKNPVGFTAGRQGVA